MFYPTSYYSAKNLCSHGWSNHTLFQPPAYKLIHEDILESYHGSESTRDVVDDQVLGTREKTTTSHIKIRFSGLVIHFIIFFIYTSIYLSLLRGVSVAARSPKHKVPSPAWEAIEKIPLEYQQQLRIVSSYQGEPSQELDQAWSELLKYSNVMVSGEDLKRINRSSIPYPGEEIAIGSNLESLTSFIVSKS
ncbi:hypothetical protein F5Y16DRAFT_268113 [Xylariaceae sp. FL0255]|nr:hypothetical protein F5Y16DRAFT_268113 [Xylariaceae sp. FL0255]